MNFLTHHAFHSREQIIKKEQNYWKFCLELSRIFHKMASSELKNGALIALTHHFLHWNYLLLRFPVRYFSFLPRTSLIIQCYNKLYIAYLQPYCLQKMREFPKTTVVINHLFQQASHRKGSLRETCPNTELFLVRIFQYLDWIQENRNQK